MTQEDITSPDARITFCGGAIDRAAHRRAISARLLRDPDARVAPLWRGRPLVGAGDAPRLLWLSADDPVIVEAPVEPPVFLGDSPEGPRFAQDVSYLSGPEEAPPGTYLDSSRAPFRDGAEFVELRALMAALPHDEAGDAATARGILEWRRTHLHCARCGAPSAQEEGGWRRGCPACGAQHFPRTDPVAIMLVLSRGRALLGRQAMWPRGMFSLLAGFMEPGESIEEAVRREVVEESGIHVGRVSYVLSQPWPFPASLMIGCVAEALDEEIVIDPEELEHALWATRDEVASALRGEGPFAAPRLGSAAREIMTRWVSGALDAAPGARP